MYRLQPDAAASLASHSARAHLRVVGAQTQARSEPAPVPQAVPSTERSLLDAWREAHWTLRLRIRDGLSGAEREGIEAAYDTARRADNRLTEFYQARADHLGRRLRATLASPGGAGKQVGVDPVDGQELTLLRHFRSLTDEDRASLVRLASRLSPPPAGG